MAELPLHGGNAPRWLFTRMVQLGRGIVNVLVDEHGPELLLSRLADPHWFQALSCVLGYDYHSSGTTTVTCAVLKQVLDPRRHGLAVAGGKGRSSRETPTEIARIGELFKWSTREVKTVRHASRISAKVDSAVLQDGFALYHHTLVAYETGQWIVIQQGMNPEHRTARRYHWNSEHVQDFVVEPHDAIMGDPARGQVLDMTARQGEASRKVSVDLVNEGVERLKRTFKRLRHRHQTSLDEWTGQAVTGSKVSPTHLYMPFRVNWNAVKRAYDNQPTNYEELVQIEGLGASTIRGLALVSEIIYGCPPSWRDPIRYAFAYGGKDGVPFPVDRAAMDASINFLRSAVEQADAGDRVKIAALRRLRGVVTPSPG